MSSKILLNYSPEKAGKPVIASIIKETGIPINILHADLTPEGGEIFIEADAEKDRIDEMIELFEKQGVRTEKITRGIILDEDSCLECGACVSLCPTDALQLTKDFSIELNEEKCVYCDACVPACPVKALSLKKKKL